MKVITLTATQIEVLAPLKTALDAAAATHISARVAYETEVQAILTAAGVQGKRSRATLSDDGNSLVV